MHTDVHDRALLYYRLITTNLDEVRVCCFIERISSTPFASPPLTSLAFP